LKKYTFYPPFLHNLSPAGGPGPPQTTTARCRSRWGAHYAPGGNAEARNVFLELPKALTARYARGGSQTALTLVFPTSVIVSLLFRLFVLPFLTALPARPPVVLLFSFVGGIVFV